MSDIEVCPACGSTDWHCRVSLEFSDDERYRCCACRHTFGTLETTSRNSTTCDLCGETTTLSLSDHLLLEHGDTHD